MSSFAERLARVNARATRKYSELTQLDGRDLYGVYEAPYAGDTFGQVNLANSAPSLTVQAADVSDDDAGKILIVRDISYRVLNLEPDGFGDTVLRLGSA